jgi:class 3 adenylate cyclase
MPFISLTKASLYALLLPTNKAARMESNGSPNCIHISNETADLLAAAGKSQWIKKRTEKIEAKGKNNVTFFHWHVVCHLRDCYRPLLSCVSF